MGNALTEEEQREYLRSKINGTVNFTYPEPPYDFEGTLKDRFVDKSGEDDYVTYWNIIDLIKFKDEEEDWLRFTYYRYKKKAIPPKKRTGWVSAGQTSLSNPMSQFEEFFVKAIKEKQWMKTFFRDIFR